VDYPDDSKDVCTADSESEIARDHGIKNLESPEQQDVSATPKVRRLILPTWESQSQAEKVLEIVHTMETRKNNGIKKT